MPLVFKSIKEKLPALFNAISSKSPKIEEHESPDSSWFNVTEYELNDYNLIACGEGLVYPGILKSGGIHIILDSNPSAKGTNVKIESEFHQELMTSVPGPVTGYASPVLGYAGSAYVMRGPDRLVDIGAHCYSTGLIERSILDLIPKPVSVPGGIKFLGLFKNNQPEGQGIAILPDGTRYEGESKGGKMEGGRKLSLPNGYRYEGDFKDDKLEGQGIIFFPDGTRYEGQVKNGMPEGQGVLIAGNIKISAEFKAGLPGTRRTMEAPDYKLVAEFKNNKPEGRGTITYNTGITLTGDFKNGDLEGPVEAAYPGGIRRTFVFKNGKPIYKDSQAQLLDVFKHDVENYKQINPSKTR